MSGIWNQPTATRDYAKIYGYAGKEMDAVLASQRSILLDDSDDGSVYDVNMSNDIAIVVEAPSVAGSDTVMFSEDYVAELSGDESWSAFGATYLDHLNMLAPTERRVLVIAGSDSSGGAGIEADQRVLALHKCYALTAVTALTAQNTTGVDNILPTPPNFVINAIETVWEDVGVDVVKIGMLSSAPTVSAVARTLQAKRDRGDSFAVVLDPVMKSTSGSQLLPLKAVSVLRYELLPLATIVTPNIPEAQLLVSRTGGTKAPPQTKEALIDLAKEVYNLAKVPCVLLKGGHFDENAETNGNDGIHDSTSRDIVDVFYDGTEVRLIEKTFIATKNTHGTGCSLASAIAANLAIGLPVSMAVDKAASYVERGIKSAAEWKLGKGNGPIDHWS